jgi:hypothetical protein
VPQCGITITTSAPAARAFLMSAVMPVFDIWTLPGVSPAAL